LALLCGLAVVTGLLETFAVASIFPLVSATVAGSEAPASGALQFIWAGVALIPAEPLLAKVGLLFAGLILLVMALRIVHQVAMYRFAAKVARGTMESLLGRLLRTDYEYFVRRRRGDLVYRLWNAPQQVAGVVSVTSNLAFAVVVSACLFGFLLLLSWKAALIMVGVGAVYYRFVAVPARNRLYRVGKAQSTAAESTVSVLSESIDGIKHVKAFGIERAVTDAHRSAISKFWSSWATINYLSPAPSLVLRSAVFAGMGIALALFAVAYAGEVEQALPLYATIAFGYLRLAPQLSQISETRLRMAAALADLELVKAALEEPEPKIREGGEPCAPLQDAVVFRDVGFRYAPGKEVLRGLSLVLRKNETTALVGPSGAGKTTVVDLLLRLYDPTEGGVFVDGKDIRSFRLDSWRNQIGLVSQDPFLAHASVEENIRFGLDPSRVSTEDVVRAAKQAHAHEFIETLPQGYATVLGDRGVRLSGGQRQRVAIARALLRKPAILILDEATSSLDNVSEAAVQSAIEDLAREMTILIVAHRLSTVRRADRIVVLKDGTIAEEGTPSELLARRGSYWALYEAQADGPPALPPLEPTTAPAPSLRSP
jgi:ATP-binding cassette subfamily B protein/subfamily B ATP-binding cassette protein MsbA